MRRSSQLSAAQLAALCGLGGLIAAAGFLLEIPAHAAKAHHPCTTYWLWTASVVTLVIVGFALALRANSSLQNGIAAARWNDQEIESLRALLNSRPSNFLNIALLALMFAFLALSLASEHQLRSIFWALFVLSQTLTWLRNTTLRQPSNPQHQPTWSNLSPLRSDHWGQP